MGFTLLYLYLAGAVLVWLRLAWHILYRLDKYDRRYCNTRATLWVMTLLWPFYLLAPKTLLHPKFRPPIHFDERAEEDRRWDRLAQQPPPCSTEIHFVMQNDAFGKVYGEFVFDASEAEVTLAEGLIGQDNAHRCYSDILHWLRQRDARLDGPTKVPAPWNKHFGHLAVGLMQRGKGKVRCLACRQVIPHDQIALETIGQATWHFNVWTCPQHHPLLSKDSVHFHLRPGALERHNDAHPTPQNALQHTGD